MEQRPEPKVGAPILDPTDTQGDTRSSSEPLVQRPVAALVQYARTGRLETLAMQAFTTTDERICTEIDNFSFARRLPTR